MNKKIFNPRDFGFRYLDSFNESLQFFELDFGFKNTKVDLYRLNTYLTQDGSFVTIWWGLFDAGITESEMEGKFPEELHFREQYNTEMFRGYIEGAEEARIILNAIRFKERKPQHIFLDAENNLCCEIIGMN